MRSTLPYSLSVPSAIFLRSPRHTLFGTASHYSTAAPAPFLFPGSPILVVSLLLPWPTPLLFSRQGLFLLVPGSAEPAGTPELPISAWIVFSSLDTSWSGSAATLRRRRDSLTFARSTASITRATSLVGSLLRFTKQFPTMDCRTARAPRPKIRVRLAVISPSLLKSLFEPWSEPC